MTRLPGLIKRMVLLATCGTLFTAGGCLPPNYLATLLSDTIVPGVAGALLDSVLASAGL